MTLFIAYSDYNTIENSLNFEKILRKWSCLQIIVAIECHIKGPAKMAILLQVHLYKTIIFSQEVHPKSYIP